MQQPNPSHNPLNAAANQAMQVARETKSPAMEKMAIGTMILSAVVSTGLAIVQVVRMITHDRERAEDRAYQRLRRQDARDRAEEGAYPPSKPERAWQERVGATPEREASHGRSR